MDVERLDTVVIGGGQAGLATGYYLRRAQRQFAILDAHQRVGDAWRHRWDSLRLFSPASIDALPGLPFPAPGWSFPTKDELGDYLEQYAARFALPVRTGVTVTRVSRAGERFVIEHGDGRIESDNVVVASGYDHVPSTPEFAGALRADILQLHSSEYRRPSQLRPGDTLVVGAGNSGAEIALDIASTRRTLLSGMLRRAPVGPSRNRVLTALLWPIVTRVLTVETPMGRRMRAKLLAHPSAPVERVTAKALATAGVERVARTVGTRDGAPLLEDGRAIDVANVIWCTGYRAELRWIDLPIFDERGEPRQLRGVVEDTPGLYFVGRFFQHRFASSFVGGVGLDARYVVERLQARASTRHAPRAGALASAASRGK